MIKFLVFNTGYKDVEIGLFYESKLIESYSIESKAINKNLLNLLSDILNKNNMTLENLSFIAANQGPAPFTTLRVSLTTVNGLNFATQIPLVGVNGLKAFLNAYKNNKKTVIALLNAFSQDLYYGIQTPENKIQEIGYKNNLVLLKNLASEFNNILFIGNGVELYKEQIKDIFLNKAEIKAEILEPLPNTVSLKSVAIEALNNWNLGATTDQLLPIYLKN